MCVYICVVIFAKQTTQRKQILQWTKGEVAGYLVNHAFLSRKLKCKCYDNKTKYETKSLSMTRYYLCYTNMRCSLKLRALIFDIRR